MQIAPHDTQALRSFGWQMTFAWPLLFGLLLPWLFSFGWPLWPWLLAAVFALLAALAPQWLYWPARCWLAFARVMAWINTRLILALMFYIVITPMGLVLRRLGKLDYRARAPGGSSHWQQSEPASSDNMKDPF